MKILFALIISLMSLSAQARDSIEFTAAFGLRSNEADTDVSSADVTPRIGLQVGALAYLPMLPMWGLRTGVLYTQRYIDLGPALEGDVEVRYSYFDIPLTPMIRFNEYAGVFAGPVIAFNQSKDVSCSKVNNCSAYDVRSIVVPFEIGIQFRIFYQLGAELYYEYVHGELSTNVSNMRTVGGNLILYFE